ncbi:EthD domain-containing protein [Chloroflexota bacterium]
MYKTVSIFSLPEGTDPEEFWKYHTEVHATDVKKAAGNTLKKYVLNRVVTVERGEPKFWGLIEMWWENKEARGEYPKRSESVKTASGKTPLEDFRSRVISGFGAHVEEKEISL